MNLFHEANEQAKKDLKLLLSASKKSSVVEKASSRPQLAEPCPRCGSRNRRNIHCKVFCGGCRILLENCSGD